MKQLSCPSCGETRFFNSTLWAAYTAGGGQPGMYPWPYCETCQTGFVNADGNIGGTNGDGM